jgi:hypothetical protein
MATMTATTGVATTLAAATAARATPSASATTTASVTATSAATAAGVTASNATTRSGRLCGTTTTLRLLACVITRLRLLRPDGGNTLSDGNFQRLSRLGRVVEVWQFQARQRAADRALDSANLVFFVGGTQRQRTPRSTRARGTTHAVDVVLGNLGDTSKLNT